MCFTIVPHAGELGAILFDCLTVAVSFAVPQRAVEDGALTISLGDVA